MHQVLLAHTLSPYAALLALMFVGLSFRIANMRRLLREGKTVDAAVMERAIRAQANFIEYVPFALLLIWLAGTAGTDLWVIHLMGLLLLIGRIAHAYSILVEEPKHQRYGYRAFGIMLTYLVFIVTAGALLVQWCGLLFA